MLIHMDSSEVDDWLEERLGWAALYQEDAHATPLVDSGT